MKNDRLSVRDLIGPVLIFFGVLLVVAALSLPLYLVRNLEKTPMNLDSTAVSHTVRSGQDGSDQLPATLFNPCSINKRAFSVVPAALTTQQRIVAVKPAGADRVTLQVGTSTNIDQIKIGNAVQTPTGNGSDGKCLAQVWNATIDRVTVNRSSATPVSGGARNSDIQLGSTEKTVNVDNRSGLQYRFPFDVKRKSYQYFDQTTRKAFDARYSGETTVAGRKAYHFTQTIPETNLSELTDANGQPPLGSTITKPASWFGSFPGIDPKMSLPATLFYSANRDLYVDPATGTILNQRYQMHKYYKFSGFSDDSPQKLLNFRLTDIDATFEYTDNTQKAFASEAKKLAAPVTLWGLWMPIVFGVVGAIVLIAGVVLLLRSGRRPSDRASGRGSGDESAAIPTAAYGGGFTPAGSHRTDGTQEPFDYTGSSPSPSEGDTAQIPRVDPSEGKDRR